MRTVEAVQFSRLLAFVPLTFLCNKLNKLNYYIGMKGRRMEIIGWSLKKLSKFYRIWSGLRVNNRSNIACFFGWKFNLPEDSRASPIKITHKIRQIVERPVKIWSPENIRRTSLSSNYNTMYLPPYCSSTLDAEYIWHMCVFFYSCHIEWTTGGASAGHSHKYMYCHLRSSIEHIVLNFQIG